MSRREGRSPFPQRYIEPGDNVLVVRTTADPMKLPMFNGHVGVVEDYAAGPGTYVVSDIPFILHHSELFVFDWEWSGT